MKIRYKLFLMLITMHCVLFTTENKKIVFYAKIEDKKWDLKRLFFIGKKDKDSTLYTIPKNIINYIFEYVIPEPRCYIKSQSKVDIKSVVSRGIEDIHLTHHFYYRMGSLYYLKDRRHSTMYCYTLGSDVLGNNSILKGVTTVLQKNIGQSNCYRDSVDKIFVCNMTPTEFQEQLDTANRTVGPLCILQKGSNGQREFFCDYK